MTDGIVFEGIETNNLKNISVDISKHKITAIAGVSGGGKSSLAYDTVHSICHQTFKSIESGYFEDAQYIVSSYKGIIPSIGIKQINSNTNPRSTLYSYLNIASILSSIKNKKIIDIPFERLKLNSPHNECSKCSGSGVLLSPSISLLIDSEKKIKDNPILPWKTTTSNKFEKLLSIACEQEKIDVNKRFFELSRKHQDYLLNGTSKEKYSFSFKINGKYRKRELPFTGVIKEMEQSLSSSSKSEFIKANKYCSSEACKYCLGTRLDAISYSNLYIGKISFIDFISNDIDSVLKEIKKIRVKSPALEKLKDIFSSISDIGLGYLSLARPIPTLSGGELQKLNFSQLVQSDITNILIVIDEISSQVHTSDYQKIFEGIQKIKERGNTILLVEHSSYFIRKSDVVIEVGPLPGKDGGHLIGPYNYWIPTQDLLEKKAIDFDYFLISNINKNNVIGLDIEIPIGGTVGIVGKSGAGKSSLAKYINENYKNSEYISQSNISNNVRSTVSTYLDINKILIKLFSDKFDKDAEVFSYVSGASGACSRCDGKGVVRYERSFEKSIDTKCDQCDGLLFSEISSDFKLNSTNISELYNTELKLLPDLLDNLPKKLLKLIDIANNLGLSHLSLNRKTSTLSGGEQKRLKLLSSYLKNVKDKILIIDEPGSGLDDWTSSKVSKFIDSQKSRYFSTVIIDHKPSVFLHMDHIIEIGPGPGDKGGKAVYQGGASNYYIKKIAPLLEG